MAKEKQIAAGEFKAKCLELMDLVQETKTTFVITKRGKPVAKLVPADKEPLDPHAFWGCMNGLIEITGDIISPIDVKWEAEADD